MDIDPLRSKAVNRSASNRRAGVHRSLTILVADDEAAVREILAVLLAESGHVAETARDGVEALAKFGQGSYDLVLTDRAMPNMNGDELASHIKERSPRTPVILITGLAGSVDRVGKFGKAWDLLIKKPFTLADILNGIDEAMKKTAEAGCS